MGTRSCGSVTVSFGLISIPVKLYLAASSESFSFNMINSKTGSRVQQKLVDAATGEEVSRGECNKGYEYSKEQYVIFTEEELKAIEGERINSLELSEFIDEDYLDPVQVEKTYYLAPDKGAEKSYRLLARAMESAGKVAVGKYYARGRDNLVMIEPNNGELVMYQLYYQSEVRPFEYKFSNASEPGDKELMLAKKLIGQLSSKSFDPGKYYDQYAERIRVAIDSKVKGETPTSKVASKPQTNILDLLTLLEKSLNQ